MAGKQDGWGLRKVQALGSQQSVQAALFHRITRGFQLEPQLGKTKSGCWSTAQSAQATSPQTPAQTQGAGWSTLERVPSTERRPGDAGESPPLSGSRSPRGVQRRDAGDTGTSYTLSILPRSQAWQIKRPRGTARYAAGAAPSHYVTCASPPSNAALPASECPAVSGGCSPPPHLSGGGGGLG